MSHKKLTYAGRVRTASRDPFAGVSLRKRRRWYADDPPGADDDDATPGASDDEQESQDSDDDPPGGDDQQDDVAWLRKELKRVREEAAARRTELRKIEQEREEAERKKREEQGEYQKLYEEQQAEVERLKAYEEQVTQLREAQAARNAERVKKLDKDARTRVEGILETAGLDDPYKVQALLDELLPTITPKPQPPSLDGGKRGDGQNGAGKPGLNKVSF